MRRTMLLYAVHLTFGTDDIFHGSEQLNWTKLVIPSNLHTQYGKHHF